MAIEGLPPSLAALDPKVTADNGGAFSALLQPEHQQDADADPAAIAAALQAVGIMKAGAVTPGTGPAGPFPGAAQADSVATDVAGLVTDFNTLLANLRTTGIIADT